MAFLPDGRLIAEDSSGNRVNGAWLRVRETGGTTLASIYSDSGLTTPMANPVQANSAGVFPQVFGAEGATVDCAMFENSGGALGAEISGRSFSMTFTGAATGSITRDFSANGRVAILGRGGNPHLEFGDATGDDTGGTGRIGGWNDTQADSLELDAALVNTTGPLKENSKKLVGIVYTDVTQVTAAASVDIQLPNSPSGVREYLLEIWDYSQSGAGNCNARFSFNGGGTYPSAAGSYNGGYYYVDTAGLTASTFSNTFAQLHVLRGGANAPVRGTISILTPNSGNDSTHILSDFFGLDSTTYFQTYRASMYGPGSSGRATHIRLLMSANTFTFKYRLIIKRGSGDA